MSCTKSCSECTSSPDSVCIPPWGCLYTKNYPSNIGYGIGIGSPYQIDITQLCSPSNPRALQTYPCQYLNAGLIVSVGIGGGGLMIIIGFLFLTMIGKLPKIKIETNPLMAPNHWSNRVNALVEKIEKGSAALALSSFLWTMIFAFLAFSAVLITFTIRQRVDLTDGIRHGGALLSGVIFSLVAIYISLTFASKTINPLIRTAQDNNIQLGMRVGMSAGAGTSFLSIGMALCMLCGMYLFMTLDRDDPIKDGYPTVTAAKLNSDRGSEYFAYGNRCKTVGNGSFCGQVLSLQSLCGYAIGISLVALILKSVTGIFSKASEIGDELVDKLESRTVDQVHNPAQSLDYIGNLGVEFSGQTSDLMESMVLSILATAFLAQGNSITMAIPFWIAGFGVFSAWIGQFFATVSPNATTFDARYNSASGGFRTGLYITVLLSLALSAVTIGILYPMNFPYSPNAADNAILPSFLGPASRGWTYFAVCCVGIGTSLAAWECTSFFTAHKSTPTKSVAAAGATGAATHLIQGFGIGMISCIPIAILLVVDIIGCHAIAGQYGVALSAVATLTPLAYAVAVNGFAPISYAASSLVCGTEAEQSIKDKLAPLDMVGMSNMAETRGWSVFVAIKTACAVLMAFKNEAGQQYNIDAFRHIDGTSIFGSSVAASSISMNRGGIEGDVIGEGIVFGAAIVGAFMPLVCAGLNVMAVSKTTREIVDNARLQINDIRQGKSSSYNVELTVNAAFTPAMWGAALTITWSILVPMFFGFLIGPRVLVGFVAGGIFGGSLLAIVSVNAGSSWAKCEASIAYEGVLGGADSEAHKASWIGTRFGGVLRDVVGPTATSVMKTMAMTALLIAPLIFTDKDIYTTTSDNLPRVAPANENQLYCSASQWWADNFRSADYFLGCVMDRSVSGLSTLSCFDWNKAYWGAVPAFFICLASYWSFVAYWMKTPPPLKLETASKPPNLLYQTVPQYVEMTATQQMPLLQASQMLSPQIMQGAPQYTPQVIQPVAGYPVSLQQPSLSQSQQGNVRFA